MSEAAATESLTTQAAAGIPARNGIQTGNCPNARQRSVKTNKRCPCADHFDSDRRQSTLVRRRDDGNLDGSRQVREVCTGPIYRRENRMKLFVGYPSQPKDIGDTISAFMSECARRCLSLEPKPWPQLDIFGASIPDTVLQAIETCDLFVADLTISNHNVLYELGYAIGKRKPILPVLNGAFSGALQSQLQLGIFDTTGLLLYQDHNDLTSKIDAHKNISTMESYFAPINRTQPVFVVEPGDRNVFINNVISAVKASIAFFHSYDPQETPRLPVTRAIREVSSSAGVVIPLLGPNYRDAERHNLLAAFVAGLSTGLDRHALIIQSGNEPVPADYRDMVRHARDAEEIKAEVFRVAQDAVRSLQTISTKRKTSEKPLLWTMSLGAIAAESEFRTLAEYFLETNEYKRAARGEGTLVVGRKGSGKSAIFFQGRDTRRRERNNVVVDLKPETYQLTRFREIAAMMLSQGVLDHTMTAFWQ